MYKELVLAPVTPQKYHMSEIGFCTLIWAAHNASQKFIVHHTKQFLGPGIEFSTLSSLLYEMQRNYCDSQLIICICYRQTV